MALSRAVLALPPRDKETMEGRPEALAWVMTQLRPVTLQDGQVSRQVYVRKETNITFRMCCLIRGLNVRKQLSTTSFCLLRTQSRSGLLRRWGWLSIKWIGKKSYHAYSSQYQQTLATPNVEPAAVPLMCVTRFVNKLHKRWRRKHIRAVGTVAVTISSSERFVSI